MSRKVWIAGAVLAAVLAVDAAILAFAVQLFLKLDDPSAVGSSVILMLAAGTGGTWMTIAAARRWSRTSRILRDVPAHEGRVCPECLSLLEPRSGAASAHVCSDCCMSYGAKELTDHWETWPFRRQKAKHTNADIEPEDEERLNRHQRFVRRHPRVALLIDLLLVVLFVALLCLVLPGHWLTNIATRAHLVLMLAAISCLTLGFGWRTGREAYCAHCGYQKAIKAGPRCPECGIDWTRRDMTVRGRRVRSVPALLIGILLLGAMLISITARSYVRQRIYTLLPSSVLIDGALGSGRDLAWEEWGELRRRTLTPQQADHLARQLMALADGGESLILDAKQWLATQLDANGLSPALLDDLHGRTFRISGLRCEPIRGETTHEIQVMVDCADSALVRACAGRPYLLIDVVSVDDVRQVFVERHQVFPLTPETVSPRERLLRSRPGDPRIRIPAMPVGRHVIQVQGWYIFAPSSTPLTVVVRDAAGHPILPKGVGYTRPFTLEDTITIPE